MLIYNSQKEFIGIDGDDLKSLGFDNLSQLMESAKEFADFFVKTSGHIHNFKHVHWIDYILCMDDGEEAKVIIEVNDKNYKSNLTIDTVYLTNNPSEEAYLVNLKNLRVISYIDSEIEVEEEIVQEEVKESKPAPTIDEAIVIEEEPITQNHIKIADEIKTDVEEPLDILLEDDEVNVEPETIEIAVEENISEDISVEIEDENKEEIPVYKFDPKVASDELGLPIDLIEEFIEDFINQAKEFKDELYTSLENGDFDTVQKLSHKLKGVAANLRIEDAKEILIIINTSKDENEVKKNLNILYQIISRLANEDVLDVPKVTKDDIFDDLLLPLDDDIQSEVTQEIKPQVDDSIEIEKDYIIDLDELDSDERISYDKVIAANEIGLDENSFNQLFNDFKHETNILCENIQTAIDSNDYKTWQQRAIELRSMSENMRLYDFNDALITIIDTEDSIKVQDALDTIKSIIIKISEQ